MKNAMTVAIKQNGYYFDHKTLVLTATKVFLKKSGQLGSDACNVIVGLFHLYPEMKIQEYTASKKVSDTITYELMERYICLIDNKEKRIAALKEMRCIQKQSVAHTSPYRFVYDWFKEKFPEYDSVMKRNADGTWGFVKEEETEEESNIDTFPSQNEQKAACQ